jgi:hypothetical protein
MAEIEGQKGLGTTGYLKLIAPIKRDMGDQATLIVMDETQVNFGCEGIESFDAKLGLVLTSDKIIAVNDDGIPTKKPISTKFETSFASFDQFTASFTIDNSFMFKGLDDVIFTLKGAVIDQDDLTTPSSIQFPENYFSGDNNAELKLWRGISISEASVALPKALKKPIEGGATSNERITLTLNKVLIDNNGFSAFVEANNVLHSDLLQKDQWAMSIEDILLQMEKNNIVGFGFGGKLNIPPFGKNSLTPYRATFHPSVNEYEFVAGLKGSYEFPVFRAKLELLETSTLEILIKDSDIYPTINATGKISIDAPINEDDKTKKFTLPDVNFEQLKISRVDPYGEFGAIGVTGEIKSPEVAGFQLTISEIGSFDNETGAGFTFNAGIKISEMFKGDAGLQLYGDYKSFKFSRVNIDEASIYFKSNAFIIEGSVAFKNGDAMYGTGFRGELGLTVVDKFELEAIGVFGKVNNYRYFLTDVFLTLEPSAGIVVGPLSFYGFGGGMYRHMQQSTLGVESDFGKALSGINYVPDKKVSMGFMAATKFGLVGTESAFNANVSFEMQFNEHNGLNFMQLRGDGAFMTAPGALGNMADQINEKVKTMEKTSGKLKLTAKSDLKEPETKASAILSASMNFKYDVANKTFTADLSTYLDAGFIKGIGPNGRMGWASAYVSPDSWYTYIGTPSDRLGIDIIGLVKATSYFMIGDKIPELPLPPEKVLKNLSEERKAKLERNNFGDLGSGKGIAFGQSLEIGFDATLFPFYASMHVGLGGEFLLKNYGKEAYCAGSSGTLGMDGWYAKGQAWAYVEAEIGMRAKIFRKTHTFSILDISAGALLTCAGPNPFYFSGSVGGQYSVMGGMISGQCDFDFEIGEQCIILGGSPFGEDVIASITPGDGEKDINVFTTPQMVLNIPADFEMRIEEAEGLYANYKVSIEEFTVRYKDNNQVITGLFQLSDDGKTYMLDPDEPFESQKQIEMIAKVGFQRKLNGQWENVKSEDGTPVIEEKTYTFTSGDRPDYILPQHVKYSYPIDRQFNFYPDEYETGYVMVTENYAYLFTTDKPEGFTQVVRVTQNGNVLKDVSFTHKTGSAGSEIRLEVEFDMSSIPYINNTIYNLALINKPIEAAGAINSNIKSTESTASVGGTDMTITTQEAEGNKEVLEVKEIYGVDFRVSDYNSLEAKLDKINPRSNGARSYVSVNIHDIKTNVYVAEGFDKFEFDETNPILILEADLTDNNWYKSCIYKKMYEEVDKNNISRGSTLDKLGYPPVGGVEIRNANTLKLLTDDEIKVGGSNFNASTGNFTYSIPYWASKDLAKIRTYAANKKANGKSVSAVEQQTLTLNEYPKVKKGDYEIVVKYKLPGKNTYSSELFETMYNPLD